MIVMPRKKKSQAKPKECATEQEQVEKGDRPSEPFDRQKGAKILLRMMRGRKQGLGRSG